MLCIGLSIFAQKGGGISAFVCRSGATSGGGRSTAMYQRTEPPQERTHGCGANVKNALGGLMSTARSRDMEWIPYIAIGLIAVGAIGFGAAALWVLMILL